MPEVQWRVEGTGAVIPNAGDDWSEEQYGQSSSKRYMSYEVPEALVRVHVYVVRSADDIANGWWDVEQRLEYLLGSDPQDRENTITWSHVIRTRGSLNGYKMTTENEATWDAGYRIQQYHQEMIRWNGSEGGYW